MIMAALWQIYRDMPAHHQFTNFNANRRRKSGKPGWQRSIQYLYFSPRVGRGTLFIVTCKPRWRTTRSFSRSRFRGLSVPACSNILSLIISPAPTEVASARRLPAAETFQVRRWKRNGSRGDTASAISWRQSWRYSPCGSLRVMCCTRMRRALLTSRIRVIGQVISAYTAL